MTSRKHEIVNGEMLFYCAQHDAKEVWIEGQKATYAILYLGRMCTTMMVSTDANNKKYLNVNAQDHIPEALNGEKGFKKNNNRCTRSKKKQKLRVTKQMKIIIMTMGCVWTYGEYQKSVPAGKSRTKGKRKKSWLGTDAVCQIITKTRTKKMESNSMSVKTRIKIIRIDTLKKIKIMKEN